MQFRVIFFLLFMAFFVSCQSQKNNREFQFEFEGKMLHGILDFPEGSNPKGIVLIVHGSGKTNAVEQGWYGDFRETINKAGYATYMWDKMGCGLSDGDFDYNQPVENSAEEVIAAIESLKKHKIPGAKKIGLWGISRAGWINPLVINKYNDIEFWISVSGVDAKENFKYLLEQNLEIDGVPKDSIKLISDELVNGYKICHSGGGFEDYMNATSNLRNSNFYQRFNNNEPTKEGYLLYQSTFRKETLDEETSLQVYIDDFDEILSAVQCPVLALFGENDRNVDWRQTKRLYEKSISSELTTRSFPKCNHNLFQCNTGGFYEFQDNDLPWDRCEDVLQTIFDWLVQFE